MRLEVVYRNLGIRDIGIEKTRIRRIGVADLNIAAAQGGQRLSFIGIQVVLIIQARCFAAIDSGRSLRIVPRIVQRTGAQRIGNQR